MSLQSYTANYWPGVHTTGLLVVHVNTDFFKIFCQFVMFPVRVVSMVYTRPLHHLSVVISLFTYRQLFIVCAQFT